MKNVLIICFINLVIIIIIGCASTGTQTLQYRGGNVTMSAEQAKYFQDSSARIVEENPFPSNRDEITQEMLNQRKALLKEAIENAPKQSSKDHNTSAAFLLATELKHMEALAELEVAIKEIDERLDALKKQGQEMVDEYVNSPEFYFDMVCVLCCLYEKAMEMTGNEPRQGISLEKIAEIQKKLEVLLEGIRIYAFQYIQMTGNPLDREKCPSYEEATFEEALDYLEDLIEIGKAGGVITAD